MIKIRNLLPKSLFGRTLIIIVIPMLLLQFVLTYVFFERHWEDVGRRLALALGGQINSISEQIKDSGYDEKSMKNIFLSAERNYLMNIKWTKEMSLSNINQHPLSSVLDFTLDKALIERIKNPFKFNTNSSPKTVNIYIQISQGLLVVSVARKTLYSSTTIVFMGWMIITALLLILISTYFLSRQIIPLKNVALAAEAFGKGDNYHELRPRGASEVRMVAQSFLEMRERIRNQIRQRTEMLAGIGHDLRTPLTRINLQIALIKDRKASQNLNRDVEEMKDMIDAYLTFTRDGEEESTKKVNLTRFIRDIKKRSKINLKNLKIKVQKDISANIKQNSLRRAVVNLLNNASNYCDNNILLSLEKKNNEVFITVEDDGPGIPDSKREDVFKAFFRLDKSRPLKSGNTGLGLTITRDIIRGHGGEIHLTNSKLGGLKVILRIPS